MLERAAYEASLGLLSTDYQNTTQERLNMEAAVGQQYLALRQELQKAEQEYTQNLRQEARQFADGIRAEFAEEFQAQSLLAAEGVHHQDTLEEQSTRWQDAPSLVTQGAEELHREEAAREELAG